jgi:hypothetical protein
MLRDLDSADGTISLQPPPEATTDQVIVDDDLIQRQAGRLRCRRLDARHGLAADPDFATVLADMNRAVHRLHGRVREEGEMVGRLDLGDGARHGPVDIADVLRHRPGFERRLFELACDRIGRELGVRTVVPFDLQGREPFLRSPHMVGHDGNSVIEAHDLPHALHRLGRRIIHALHAPPEDGRLRERRDLHAGRPDVDAVNGRAVDLRRGVQPLGRRADKLEILRPLERHVFGHRHAGSIGGKLAICGASSCRRVAHFTALRAARGCIHIPALCRRGDEHGSRDCTGLAQGLPRCAYGVGVAGCLYAAEQGIAVELFVGRSMLQPDLLQVHLQLFRDQHGDRGIGALTHLHVGHGQDNLPIALDADEGVGCEAIGAGRFGVAVCERQAQTQHQASARGRSDLQERAPGGV